MRTSKACKALTAHELLRGPMREEEVLLGELLVEPHPLLLDERGKMSFVAAVRRLQNQRAIAVNSDTDRAPCTGELHLEIEAGDGHSRRHRGRWTGHASPANFALLARARSTTRSAISERRSSLKRSWPSTCWPSRCCTTHLRRTSWA